jgi:ATP-dependent exoDNAse (exonuclease V) beta subunit
VMKLTRAAFNRPTLSRAGEFKEHSLVPYTLPSFERIESPLGRQYLRLGTDETYPSVTTVLDVLPKPELDEWRRAVGPEEAERVSRRATQFGSRVHGLMERYLRGELESTEEVETERILVAFGAAKACIDSFLTELNGVEVMMASRRLAIAGTTDVVGKWDGRRAIIDFKTSNGPKAASQVTHYFLQAAAYSVMLEELTGNLHDELVLVMLNLDEDNATVHVRRRTDDMIDRLVEIRRSYEEVTARRRDRVGVVGDAGIG